MRVFIFSRNLDFSLTDLNSHLSSISSIWRDWGWKAFFLGKELSLRHCDHGTKIDFLILKWVSELFCRCAVCWLSWWTSPSTSMWPPGSSSWPTQGIAVNISIRFFIVVYAHDFVKNGQFEVRLFHQIYWLAWMARVGKNATLNAKKRQKREAKTPFN